MRIKLTGKCYLSSEEREELSKVKGIKVIPVKGSTVDTRILATSCHSMKRAKLWLTEHGRSLFDLDVI